MQKLAVPTTMHPAVTIVNVGYRSTNYWVVSAGRSRLLIDLGWPGRFGELLSNLSRKDIPLEEIKYGVATHYHIDHAGCAQDLKNRGMRLIVTPEQIEAIPAMKRWVKPADNFVDITTDDNFVLPLVQSRTLLSKLGIAGELVHTPGHSDDSISLVLDNGAVFTGDLTIEGMATDECAGIVAKSWQKLRALGATTVCGGHGPVRPI
jgi:glyoxylase-like metal-dependent hydrolase (beta-lactamase superfamily II)